MAVLERCGDCRFYDKKDKECRRNAPTAVMLPGPSSVVSGQQQGPVIVGIWPSTRETLWCGEFAAMRGIT